MLALSRKKNEALIINNNIEVTVLEIKGEQVKLGISAPKDVPVYRKVPPLLIIKYAKTVHTSKKFMGSMFDLLIITPIYTCRK